MSDVIRKTAYLRNLPIDLRVVQRDIVGLEALLEGQVVSINHQMLAIDLRKEMSQEIPQN